MTPDVDASSAEPKQDGHPRTVIDTAMANLRLITLVSEDSALYYALVDCNRGHLTQHGDYLDLGEATPESLNESLRDPDGERTRFGIWLDAALIGRADLIPRTGGNYVLGYWLGGEFTGHGYATMACQSLIAYGQRTRDATTIWAGVTKGNAKSEAVLARLGFQAVSDQGTYSRFRLLLSNAPEPAGEPATSGAAPG